MINYDHLAERRSGHYLDVPWMRNRFNTDDIFSKHQNQKSFQFAAAIGRSWRNRMIATAKLAWSILRGSIADNWTRFSNSPRWNEADQETKQLLEQVWSEGFVVVPNFFDAATCDEMCQEVDRLLDEYSEKTHVTSEGADYRLFGVERVSPILNQFWEHPLLVEAFRVYCRPGSVAGCTMANRILASESNLGSGNGWHRDTANSRQFKSIAYLSDVGEDNGPFQYLRGSHKPWNRAKTSMALKKYFRERRFDTDDTADFFDSVMKDDVVTLAAPKGTLILADTSGLHRGMPLKNGCRYALTNYFANECINPNLIPLLVDASSSN